jgi:hypothetical protein
VIKAVAIHRDYDTISVGMINDHFAALALENSDKVLARSQAITRGNLAILSKWIEGQKLMSWVRLCAHWLRKQPCNLKRWIKARWPVPFGENLTGQTSYFVSRRSNIH